RRHTRWPRDWSSDVCSSDLHSKHSRARSANVLNDLSRQSPDIGPPVATDLGFITHAAERDTDEFAAHGSSDRPAERSFPYTRRRSEERRVGKECRAWW